MPKSPKSRVYGLMAEFEDPNALVAAAHQARLAGYRRMDAYSPFPIGELHEALGLPPTRLPLIVLIGGLVGCVAGYSLQYWVSVVENPFIVGGKPLHSWPAFIPITFELAILFAALAAVLGMLVRNGLPRLHHPVFNARRIRRATSKGFFLCIEARDPRFDLHRTRQMLEGLGASTVQSVGWESQDQEPRG